jgi:hypothetical protein
VLDFTGSTSSAACIIALWAGLWATGCTGAGAGRPPPVDPGDQPHSELADEDRYQPAYGRPELQKALIAERGAEATLEHRVGEIEAQLASPPAPGATNPALEDQLRVAAADLAVRRRFIATLEACEATGRWCPPRLDDPPWGFDPDADPPADPPVTATLRFDVASWRAIADELHGRACACRTLTCVDSVGVAIDQLEPRPMPAVGSDDAAATAITRARECLFRLRGKSAMRATAAPSTSDD